MYRKSSGKSSSSASSDEPGLPNRWSDCARATNQGLRCGRWSYCLQHRRAGVVVLRDAIQHSIGHTSSRLSPIVCPVRLERNCQLFRIAGECLCSPTGFTSAYVSSSSRGWSFHPEQLGAGDFWATRRRRHSTPNGSGVSRAAQLHPNSLPKIPPTGVTRPFGGTSLWYFVG